MIIKILKFLPFPIILALVPLFLPAGRTGAYYQTLLILTVSYATAALGLTVLLGFSGQISLAQAAFLELAPMSFPCLR